MGKCPLFGCLNMYYICISLFVLWVISVDQEVSYIEIIYRIHLVKRRGIYYLIVKNQYNLFKPNHYSILKDDVYTHNFETLINCGYYSRCS